MSYTTSTHDKFIHSLCLMDLGAINELLDNNQKYKDLTKAVFVSKLDTVFKKFRDRGDTTLSFTKGFCNGNHCSNYKKTGFLFVGDSSRSYFKLMIDSTVGKITDIYYCRYFHCEQSTHDPVKEITLDEIDGVSF